MEPCGSRSGYRVQILAKCSVIAGTRLGKCRNGREGLLLRSDPLLERGGGEMCLLFDRTVQECATSVPRAPLIVESNQHQWNDETKRKKEQSRSDRQELTSGQQNPVYHLIEKRRRRSSASQITHKNKFCQLVGRSKFANCYCSHSVAT